jgi:hypothetical protein
MLKLADTYTLAQPHLILNPMTLDHNQTIIEPTQWRSAITNGSSLGIDKRTPAGRRYRDLIAEFSREIAGDGGELSQSELILVRQAAAISLRVEALQIAIVEGAEVDNDDITRLTNILMRLLAQISGRYRYRKSKTGRPLSKDLPISVAEHFATRKATGRVRP